MLIEVDANTYKKYFSQNPNPFISEQFIDLNKNKADKVVRLINEGDKPGIGLVAGIKDGFIKSPFSAPFGGFHFRNEILYVSEIDNFIAELKQYIESNKLKGIDLILPPNIYHETFNAKVINSLIKSGFNQALPEITSWINLNQFKGEFSQRNSSKYYRQALRNELSFSITEDVVDKEIIYNLIADNRAKFNRPIYMKFKDIIDTSHLWPVDFFKVTVLDNSIVASAIFYRSHPSICYGVFWGDNDIGRPLRAMDYLAHNLWNYYKNAGYDYIDLGISTELGIPNEGLLRFKESHDSTSSLRFKFSWNNC